MSLIQTPPAASQGLTIGDPSYFRPLFAPIVNRGIIVNPYNQQVEPVQRYECRRVANFQPVEVFSGCERPESRAA